MKLILDFLVLLTLYQVGHCYERVKLKDVQALTLYRGKYTIGRKPIPQLSCTGLCKNQPDVVQCQNSGFDGVDAQWKCNANLDKNVKFSSISVNCEGYSYPDDPYIIAGSCGLEYRLAHRDHESKAQGYLDESSSAPFWIFIGFIAVFALIMMCKSSDVSGRPDYDYQGVPTAPPPSYSANPPPGFKHQYTEPNYQSFNQANSGPGFWSGLGLGGLGGYFFGRNSNSSYTSPPVHTDYNYYRPSRSSYQGNSFYQDDCYSDKSSGETYSAEGFGGTKRR